MQRGFPERKVIDTYINSVGRELGYNHQIINFIFYKTVHKTYKDISINPRCQATLEICIVILAASGCGMMLLKSKHTCRITGLINCK